MPAPRPRAPVCVCTHSDCLPSPPSLSPPPPIKQMGIKQDGTGSDAARAVRTVRLVRLVTVLELLSWKVKEASFCAVLCVLGHACGPAPPAASAA